MQSLPWPSTPRPLGILSNYGPLLASGALRTAELGRANPGCRQSGSRIPVFAVYLGFWGGRNHFYGVNGKWVVSMGFTSLFTVSNFATPAEIAPVLAKIPKKASPDDFDKLRQGGKGPSREDGAALIRKMTEFRQRSESIYLDNVGMLDEAQALLSDAHQSRYLSLFEMADSLLPPNLKDDGGFSAPALYAVHTALYRNEVGFRPLSPSSDCHRRDHLFEVFPQSRASIVNNVASMVREYMDAGLKRQTETALGNFVLQGREAVHRSRRYREWTPHGILKASSGVELAKVEWHEASKDVITFLELWASYDLFDSSSRFHSYGALILRALGLYKGEPLTQSTAWTFLQEIGVIAPWEILSRYRVRFPGVTIARGAGLQRETPKQLAESIGPDMAAGARRGTGDAGVFCIDAPSTTVIDDGISLERTDRADEYWIHVHAADPASSIKPNSDLCRYMELIPENIYLPGHFQAMLPADIGEEEAKDYESESLIKKFSLRPGGPALTFSARVSGAGDLLEYRVEPSTLGDVKYLDPDDVAKFCKEPPPPPSTGYRLTVGTRPEEGESKAERPMVAAQDLSKDMQEDLAVLHRLAEAIKKKRLSKGAWPYFFPRPSVSVALHGSVRDKEGPEPVTVVPADPYIEVGDEASAGCSVVSNLMVLAGEVAARWCWDRDIPIPYRRDKKAGRHSEAALAYATKEVYPLIERGIKPTQGQRQELSRLTGSIEVAARPGPYFLLGLDMYAKATSPLRRFADLLVHWQVHAALAHERRTGRAMDPAVDDADAILAFTRAGMLDTLPLLEMREKMARKVARGTVDWILIALVRAWRFEGTVPLSLRFTVGSRWQQGLVGRLDLFDLDAVLDVAGLDGVRLIRDVQVGDEFEVELADVNVHSRQILVTAKRHLGGGGGGGPEQQPGPQ